VRHEDLPLYYSAADVCVVPSHHETFGLVALESLACGTPVVATRVGGMESVIRHGENGYLLDDNSPERLADGISSIVSGRGIPIGAADAIRESVSGFGWSSIARKVAREYRATLDRPSAR